MSRPRLCKLDCGCKYEVYGERECLISQCAEHEREYQERHRRAQADRRRDFIIDQHVNHILEGAI